MRHRNVHDPRRGPARDRAVHRGRPPHPRGDYHRAGRRPRRDRREGQRERARGRRGTGRRQACCAAGDAPPECTRTARTAPAAPRSSLPDAWAAREVGSWSVAAFDSCARRMWRQAVETGCGDRLWRQVVETGCGRHVDNRLWRQVDSSGGGVDVASLPQAWRRARAPRGRWNEGAGRRRVAGDGVPRGRRRAAGVRRDRAHRAGRAALCFAERVPHVYGARCLR